MGSANVTDFEQLGIEPAARSDLQIVPYIEAMREGILSVVQEVYREYGWQWEAHGYHRDLYEVQSTYIDTGGMYWGLMDGGRCVGCVGVTMHGDESELHRLYLLREIRGQGWGRRLLETSMEFARAGGAHTMIAWSDVILREAHALYCRNGFVQMGERICNDPDKSREYGFLKEPL